MTIKLLIVTIDPFIIQSEILKGEYKNVAIILEDQEETVDNLLLKAELHHGMGLYEEQYIFAQKIFNSNMILSLKQEYSAHYWLSWARFRQGRHEESFKLANNALNMIILLQNEKKIELRKEHGQLINIIGSYYIERGNTDKGLKYLENSFQLIKKIRDIPAIATCYNNLAYAYQKKGDLLRAINDYNIGLSLLGENGDYPSQQALIYSNLGEVYRIIGEYKSAMKYHEDALKIRETLMNRHNLANQLLYLGSLYFEMQKFDDAEHFIRKSLDIWSFIDNPLWYSASLFYYCRILIKKEMVIDETLSKLFLLSEESDNTIINIRYLLIKAMDLKRSPRMNQKAEAQRILRKIFENVKYDFEIAYISLIEYLNLLFEELKLSYHADIIDEAIDIANIILRTVQENHIFAKKVEVYLILSRFYTFKWDIKRANAYFGQAYLLIVEYLGETLKGNGDSNTYISERIKEEKKINDTANEIYKSGTKLSLKERIEKFGISDLLLF